MVGLLAITGGVIASSFGVYKHFTRGPNTSRQKREAKVAGSVAKSISAHPKQFAVASPTDNIEGRIQHGIRTSTISAGVASAGLLFFPPLQYASIPILVYMGVPAAQGAYAELHDNGRLSAELAETLVLTICLASGFYLVSSLGFGLYYIGRAVHHNRNLAKELSTNSWPVPYVARLIKEAKEVIVPTKTLQQSDQVLVKTSEMVPADGVVVNGAAWLRPRGSAADLSSQLKREGDPVLAADIVMAGRLNICVRKAG